MAGAAPAPDGFVPLLEQRLGRIRAAISEAAARSGRDPASVRIVAAVKTVSPGVVALLPALGVTDLGENRVQEAEDKVRRLSDLGARWHMIGSLQTNKVRRALDLFHRVDSVDRPGVMEALAREAARRGRVLDCLLQVNVSGERTKSGFRPGETGDALRRARDLPSLRILGLLAIPAPVERAEDNRAAFRALRELRDSLRDADDHLPELSMGMSDDYAVAVEEGATSVRLGAALFGGLPASAFGRSRGAASAFGRGRGAASADPRGA